MAEKKPTQKKESVDNINDIKDSTLDEAICINSLKLELQETKILLNDLRLEHQSVISALHNRLYALEQHVIAAVQMNRDEEVCAIGTEPVKEVPQ